MKIIKLVENPSTGGPRWIWQEWNDWVLEREYAMYTDSNTDYVLWDIIKHYFILQGDKNE